LVKFDGLWLDVNEPQSLVKDPYGEIADSYDTEKNKYSSLPYKIGNERVQLEQKAISINALVYGGGPDYSEDNTIFNYKAMNPFYQIRMTNQYILKSFKRRPFILSRANFFGMGRYANHWLGDNLSTYEQLRLSIPGVFSYQMFGFNLVGADVCGFLGNVTDELCARWHVLGAFYPFSRNHNNINQTDQEPWRLGDKTLNSAKLSLRIKYSLMRYSYTQVFFSSLKGGAYFQPLFFQFPEDAQTFNHIDEQIMLGPHILFSPALYEGEPDIKAYFPNCNWNELLSGLSFIDHEKNSTSGKIMKLSGEYVKIHLHIKGGSIIPFQDVAKYNITRSHHLVNVTTEIIINPDHENLANGNIVYDDGISLEAMSNKKYIQIDITFNDTIINFNTTNSFSEYYNNDVKLEVITLLRAKRWAQFTKIDARDSKGELVTANVSYDKGRDVLSIIFDKPRKMNELNLVRFIN
jgi:alpha-glucosidase (family GH31 glycosyl hydrolase)